MNYQEKNLSANAQHIYNYLESIRETVEWVSDRQLIGCRKVRLKQNEVYQALSELEAKKIISHRKKNDLLLYSLVEEPKRELENPVKRKRLATPQQHPMLYLVDTENASNEQFYQGLEELTQNDTILLFLSQNSRGPLTPKLVHRLFNCSAKVETILLKTSEKNELDFVLVCEASMRLTKNPKQNLTIISGDSGFDSALNHLTQNLTLSTNQINRRKNFLK